jgi:hypothetical protein
MTHTARDATDHIVIDEAPSARGARSSGDVVARMLDGMGREDDERIASERLHSLVDRRTAVAAEREEAVIVGYRENVGLER